MTDRKRKRPGALTSVAHPPALTSAAHPPALTSAAHPPDPNPRKKRTTGFVRMDQRLPESPPLSNAHPASRGIMATVRARYRNAVDMLFGSVPRVLNSVCFNGVTLHDATRTITPTQPNPIHHSVAKRKRHVAPDSPRSDRSDQLSRSNSDTDQVVPNHVIESTESDHSPHSSTCPSSHQCSCANALWNADGIGPELMLRTAEELSESINVLYAKAIDPSTGDVNYSSLVHSADFHKYLATTQKLRYFDPLLLSNTERKAFFLNIYNSLMIHAIAVMSKPRTMFERISLYNTASYNIGGRPYSLNEIEHGVLRSNKRGNGPFAQPQFSESDARLQCSLPKTDPRIHFALNCGAKSCPSVRFYGADNIDTTLDAATSAYLNDVEVDYEKRIITLPKLLQWYQVDFCEDGDVDSAIKWTLPYLDEDKRDVTNKLLREKEQQHQTFKVVYAGYDWTVNDSSV